MPMLPPPSPFFAGLGSLTLEVAGDGVRAFVAAAGDLDLARAAFGVAFRRAGLLVLGSAGLLDRAPAGDLDLARAARAFRAGVLRRFVGASHCVAFVSTFQ